MPELNRRRTRKVTAGTGMAAAVVAPAPPPTRDPGPHHRAHQITSRGKAVRPLPHRAGGNR